MIKTRSIKRNLINTISAIFGLFIIIVYTFIDTSIDDWAQQQFKTGLKEKMEQIKSCSMMMSLPLSIILVAIISIKSGKTIKRSNVRPIFTPTLN